MQIILHALFLFVVV